MSNDTLSPVDGAQTKRRGPRAAATPKVTDGAPTKRSGRPAAPQNRGDALTAYVAKLQAARKALADVRAILLRLPDLEADGTNINWVHHPALMDDLYQLDYRLHAAQQVIHASGHDSPTDKVA